MPFQGFVYKYLTTHRLYVKEQGTPYTHLMMDGGKACIQSKEHVNGFYHALAQDILLNKGMACCVEMFPENGCRFWLDLDFGIDSVSDDLIADFIRCMQDVMKLFGVPKDCLDVLVLKATDKMGKIGVHAGFTGTKFMRWMCVQMAYTFRLQMESKFPNTTKLPFKKIIDIGIYPKSLRMIGTQKAVVCKECVKYTAEHKMMAFGCHLCNGNYAIYMDRQYEIIMNIDSNGVVRTDFVQQLKNPDVKVMMEMIKYTSLHPTNGQHQKMTPFVMPKGIVLSPMPQSLLDETPEDQRSLRSVLDTKEEIKEEEKKKRKIESKTEPVVKKQPRVTVKTQCINTLQESGIESKAQIDYWTGTGKQQKELRTSQPILPDDERWILFQELLRNESVHKEYKDLQIKKMFVDVKFGNTTIIAQGTGQNYCAYSNKVHESAVSYFVVNKKSCVLRQKCHSGTCSGNFKMISFPGDCGREFLYLCCPLEMTIHYKSFSPELVNKAKICMKKTPAIMNIDTRGLKRSKHTFKQESHSRKLSSVAASFNTPLVVDKKQEKEEEPKKKSPFPYLVLARPAPLIALSAPPIPEFSSSSSSLPETQTITIS